MVKRQQIGYLPPQLRKLQRNQSLTTNEVIKELKKAQRTIAKEVAYLTAKADVMASARQRERIYKMIAEHYQVLAVNLDEHITALVEQAAKGAHDLAAKEIRTSGAKSVMKYSPERTNRYLAMVNDETSGSMAAVFTDQMANREIRALRTAWVDTYRQAALTGMTANDTQRVLQNKWDKLTDNTDAFRFVDKSGKSWSNARYLQMLIRTNSQRISRDSYVDTLVESGFKLARISGGGGSTTCPICSAWAGRIVQVAGESRKWPTYEDAISAGMFHPNCIHYLEYMDETWDKKEIDLQGSIPKPPDGSTTEFIQQQKDQIDEGRYTQKGLSQIEAQRAVTRDRLKSNILTGTFNADAQRAVESLTGEQLDEIRKQGVPAFLMVKKGDNPGWHKGSRGGIVHIPREAGPDDVLKAMGLKERTEPVVPSSEIEKKRTTAVKQVRQRGKGKELFVCITPDGTVLQHDSGASGGVIPANMIVKDSVFVHNHPGGYKNIHNRTKRYGNGFSPDDLFSAASIKLKEIVAVTPRRIYSMAPGSIGWPTRDEMKKEVRASNLLIRNKLTNLVAKKRIDVDTASVLHWHMVSKLVAKKLGLKYSWKKNLK